MPDIDPSMVDRVQPDLTRFTAPALPAGHGRGRRGLWEERFERMLNEIPGQWLNATKAWGVKPSAATGARAHIRRLELRGDARVVDHELWVRVE